MFFLKHFKLFGVFFLVAAFLVSGCEAPKTRIIAQKDDDGAISDIDEIDDIENSDAEENDTEKKDDVVHDDDSVIKTCGN
ncbi:MAG TPA: hypothetical protein PKN76_04880, partial [bacterium]|nr:hypothetical protein [bacterium]HPY15417.1 hypothetical protein [bacterium]